MIARRYTIKVSAETHAELQRLASAPEYKGRGVVGVVDKMVLGRFTTRKVGRPTGAKSRKKRAKTS